MENPKEMGPPRPFRAFLPVFPRPFHQQPIRSKGGWHSTLDPQLSGIWLSSPDSHSTLGDFLAEARVRAEKRLDILSVMGAGHHTIAYRNRDVLALREAPEGQKVLIRTPHIDSIPFGMRSFQVNEPAALEPANALAGYTESMRYFRLAQVSADAFGCFTYLYRALESIMDELQFTSPDREKEWFESAVRAALARCRPTTISSLGRYSRPRPFANYVYGVRNGLFHAKTKSKRPLTPLNEGDLARVRFASHLVTLVFMDLVSEKLPLGRGERILTDLEMHEQSRIALSVRGLRLLLDGGENHDRIMSCKVRSDETHLGHLLVGRPLTGGDIPHGHVRGVEIVPNNGPPLRKLFKAPLSGKGLQSLQVQVFVAVDFNLGHRTNGWIPEGGVRVGPN